MARAAPWRWRAWLAGALALVLGVAACASGQDVADPGAGGGGGPSAQADGRVDGPAVVEGGGDGDGAGGAGDDPAVPPPTSTAAPVDPSTARIAELVATLTPEQKVGQLLAVAVMGDDATDVSAEAAAANTALFGVPTPAEVVQRYHLGGIAYFDRPGAGMSNVADLAATARLSAGLQQAAAASSGIGLLIGVDQEGGPVVRFRAPATVMPAARRIAATGDLALAQQAGAVTGAEARALGVNWVYAPVADVNVDPANPVIGDRAFGVTADEVTPWVLATARGLATSGVLAAVKHFPGHGDTSVDSHDALPTIDHDRGVLDAVDLPPFAAALEAADAEGWPLSVMVGHLALPAIDPSGRPATLSAPILDLLRGDPAAGGLGFDGLVVTDAMDMGALTGFGDAGSLAVQAVAAGVDVVLMPTDLPAAHAALLAATADGTISAERLDEAVTRVLQAKDAVGVLDAAAIPPGDPAVVGSTDHLAVRQAIGAACGC